MSDEHKFDLPPDEQIIAEATLSLLETLRSPVNQEARHKASTTLLTFYKAKPSTKSELSITKAQDWLAGIAAEAEKDADE